MTYLSRGPSCPRTCRYPQGDPNCPEVDGCQCAYGLLQDTDIYGNMKCVEPDDCSVCVYNGETYLSGETFEQDCKYW